MVWLHDALTLDAPRVNPETGYTVVRARAARVGVYQYAGYEVDPTNAHGLRDTGMVNVLRDEQTVFDERAVRSFIGKPITDDHPKQPVTKDNWREHARGTIMGALRDGDYLAFDLMLTDAAAIDKVNAGKRALSNGYAAELEFGTFTASDGTVCQARQSKITGGNHVALVDRGRAGPDCRIADGAFATCDANAEALARLTTQEKPKMKITIGDAKDVDLSDGAAVALAVGALNTSLADAQTKVGALTADLSTAQTTIEAKDGEITALKQQLEDAKVTPEKLQQMADARADVIGKAKALDPKVVTDGKTDAEIRKAAVLAKLGDKAADMTDAAIEGAFAALTVDAKPAQQGVTPIVAPQVANDHQAAFEDARSKRLERYANAYKNTPAVAS